MFIAEFLFQRCFKHIFWLKFQLRSVFWTGLKYVYNFIPKLKLLKHVLNHLILNFVFIALRIWSKHVWNQFILDFVFKSKANMFKTGLFWTLFFFTYITQCENSSLMQTCLKLVYSGVVCAPMSWPITRGHIKQDGDCKYMGLTTAVQYLFSNVFPTSCTRFEGLYGVRKSEWLSQAAFHSLGNCFTDILDDFRLG